VTFTMSHSAARLSLQEQDTLKEVQRGSKTRGFPSPSYDEFGFLWESYRLPTDKLCLSGVGHVQFEVVFHEEISKIEVEGLIGQ
jgi:hypothetical protein